MKIRKNLILFCLGGAAYTATELLWRGRSHSSMFLLGGSCFLLLGKLGQHFPRIPLWAKVSLGAALVTGLELGTGLLVNRDFAIWDYRNMPYNYQGQICLNYSLLWMPASLLAMVIYEKAERRLLSLPPLAISSFQSGKQAK